MITTIFLLMNMNLILTLVEPRFTNGMRLNYLIFQNPPYGLVIRGPNGTLAPADGPAKYLGIWMAARFNITINYVPINQTIAAKLGTNEAVLYQLLNDKEIDGILSGFYLTLDRKDKFDYTFFVVSENFAMVVPRAGEESRLFAFIRPFQPIVWLLIFVGILAVVGMLTLYQWFYFRFYTNATDGSSTKTNIKQSADRSHGKVRPLQIISKYFAYHAIYAINILTNQGGREGSERHSFRILAGFWVLVGMVLVNSYSGIVISSLTVPKLKASIQSLEDLAENNDVGVLLRADTVTGEQILSATSGIYKIVGDKARSKPDQIITDPFVLNSKLLTGRYAFPWVRTFCTVFVASQYKKDGRCRFKVANLHTISAGYYHLLAKKGSPYAYIFNKGLMDLWESGLFAYWAKEIVPKAYECFSDKRERMSARQIPIRLIDLVSAFLILGIGLGLATLRFLVEIIVLKFKKLFFVN